jgi:glyoxylase-like metal-dependent hydrolase (beta-lactamase superfamily II)
MKRFVVFVVALICLASAVPLRSEQPAWCKELPRAGYKTLRRVPVSDEWFEVYEVGPSVLAIYEPRQSEETIGYLISGSERAVLFDTGMGIGDLKRLVGQLTKLPVVVVNSHTHGDHVGGNWQFSTVYGMDTAFTRKSAKGSTEQARQEIEPSEICGVLPTGFDVNAYRTQAWTIAKTIRDGERIDVGGRTLEVIATPGHTPDAICLFDKLNGLLFTGDTYYPGTIYLFSPETDLDAYGRSVRRLVALAPQVKVVLGAHNFPISQPSVLGQLAEGFELVRNGKGAKAGAGPFPQTVIFEANGIKFLMKATEK